MTAKNIILGVGLVVVAWWAVDRTTTAQRAIAALNRDGYSNVRIIGHDCHVAEADNSDGERVAAWACPASDGTR